MLLMNYNVICLQGNVLNFRHLLTIVASLELKLDKHLPSMLIELVSQMFVTYLVYRLEFPVH